MVPLRKILEPFRRAIWVRSIGIIGYGISGINRLNLFDVGPHKFNFLDGLYRRTLPRRSIFIWVIVIVFLNQLVDVLREMRSVSLETLVSDLSAVGMFQYIAWYVIFRLLASSDRVPAARWRDFLVTVVLCLPVFLPTSRMIWVSALGIAIYVWIFNGGDAKLRAAGIVLGALSVQEFWGHILFNLVAFPLLHAETAVVGTMLEVARAGTVWRDNVIDGPSGYGIAIYTGCSSFHNLSLAEAYARASGRSRCGVQKGNMGVSSDPLERAGGERGCLGLRASFQSR